MSKKPAKKKDELPSLPKKYINERKIEEAEKTLVEEKMRNEKLMNNIKLLQSEIKSKENENVKNVLAYDYKIEDLNNQIQTYDKANTKLKVELETIRDEITNFYNDKIDALTKENEKRYSLLMAEYESEKEKAHKHKVKKNEYKQEISDLKTERSRLNDTLFSTIQKYEEIIRNNKEEYEKQIKLIKERENDLIKERETLNENEIYGVYKELKLRFEKNLNDLKGFKDVNNKINDENRIFKLTMDSSDNILKECAKIQLQKQKLLNQYKETIENQTQEIEKMNKLFDETKSDIIEQYSAVIKSNNSELLKYKSDFSLLKQENKKLKALSQMILDQRSEVEMFFIESLEEMKQEIYKKRKQEKRKKTLFPIISKKYENQTEDIAKISIKDLSLEDKEKMLKLLFSKINEKVKPRSYNDFANNEFYQKLQEDAIEKSS